jgi:hypothetical protein
MHVSVLTALIPLVYFPETSERNVGRKCISGLPKWQATAQVFKFFFYENIGEGGINKI